MAADVSITIRALGLQDVQRGFEQVRNDAQKLSNDMQQASRAQAAVAEQTSDTIQRSHVTTQRAAMTTAQRFRELGQALSGAAAVASLFARNNPELQRQLEVLSLTLSGASTAIRAFGSALRVVIGIIGIKIAILAAAVAAIVFLVRNWDQARAAAIRIWGEIAAFFRRVFSAIGTAAGGLGQILLGALTFDMSKIQAGWAQLTGGLRQLGGLAMELGRGVVSLAQAGWERLQSLFGTTADHTRRLGRSFRDTTKDMREFVAATEESVAAAAAWAALMAGRSVQQAGVQAQFAAQRFGEHRDVRRDLAGQAAGIANVGIGGPAGAGQGPDALREQLDISRAAFDLEKARLEVGASTAEQVEAARQSLVGALQAAIAANIPEAERLRLRLELLNALTRERSLISGTTEDIQEQVDVARAMLDLENERLRTGQGSADAVAAARDRLIQMLEKAEAIATGAAKIRIQIELIRLRLGEAATAMDPLIARFGQFADHAKQAFQGIRGAFEGFFTNVMSGTQSLGDALANLWRDIADSIIKQLARIAAHQVFTSLLGPLFPGLNLNSILGFQHGGSAIVDRPTLVRVGEVGAERVSVRPLSGPDSSEGQSVVAVQGGGQPQNVHITFQTLDPAAFQHWAQRNASVFHDMLLAGMRQNNKVGKLLGGAQVP